MIASTHSHIGRASDRVESPDTRDSSDSRNRRGDHRAVDVEHLGDGGDSCDSVADADQVRSVRALRRCVLTEVHVSHMIYGQPIAESAIARMLRNDDERRKL